MNPTTKVSALTLAAALAVGCNNDAPLRIRPPQLIKRPQATLEVKVVKEAPAARQVFAGKLTGTFVGTYNADEKAFYGVISDGKNEHYVRIPDTTDVLPSGYNATLLACDGTETCRVKTTATRSSDEDAYQVKRVFDAWVEDAPVQPEQPAPMVDVPAPLPDRIAVTGTTVSVDQKQRKVADIEFLLDAANPAVEGLTRGERYLFSTWDKTVFGDDDRGTLMGYCDRKGNECAFSAVLVKGANGEYAIAESVSGVKKLK